MKVFEFHFNPKSKSDLKFDSFCYEPVNIYERRMGGLYMVGMLKSILPKTQRIVDRLAKTIKNNYYRSSLQTPEKATKDSLKLANEFLDKIVQKGNVRWLGKLDFAILSLKDFKLNFSKVGKMKILVARKGEIIDIDQKINSEDMEPYPLKIFNNMISGKLAENDVVMVLTEELYKIFKKTDILKKIANLDPFNEKAVKDIIDRNKEPLVDVCGVCLAIVLTKETVGSKKSTISPEVLEEFSFKETISPLLNFFKKIKKPQISLSGLKKKVTKSIPEKVESPLKGKIKKPSFNFSFPKPLTNFFSGISKKIKSLTPSLPSDIKGKVFNKKVGLVVSFIILLSVGYFFSEMEERKKIATYTEELQEIKSNLERAKSFLIIRDTQPQAMERANSLLQEGLDKASSLSQKTAGLPQEFRQEVSSVREEINNKLAELNNLQRINEPQLVYEFNKREFVPQQFSLFQNQLYFFNPFEENIFVLTENGDNRIVETGEVEIKTSTPLLDMVVFFSSPEGLLLVNDSGLQRSSIEPPYEEFNFQFLSSFQNNLYFLEREKGQIIKYAYQGENTWLSPDLWLKKNEAEVMEADSMAIDGSIWVLNNNSLLEYYGGDLENSLEVEVFPSPEEFTKIYTTPEITYLYVMEPSQKRILVLAKDGELIEQFQSNKFDNLLDFAVSQDEQTAYLLNGLKVYRIEL